MARAGTTEPSLGAMIRRARATARREAKEQARATAARYDANERCLIIDLVSGVMMLVPIRLVPALDCARTDQVEAVELSPDGAALHWEDLDVDLAIPGLLAGDFGKAAILRRPAA